MIRIMIVCVLIASAGCASSSEVSGERRNVGSVTMTFTVVPGRAKPGQSVRLTIRLVNNAGKQTALTFPTSQKYDFWVTAGGREIWRWSSGRMFTQDVTHQELEGQTGTAFAESWTAAEMGKLVAHAQLKAETYDTGMTADLLVG
jgi:intracellular proteinase inhibitor BsuPI